MMGTLLNAVGILAGGIVGLSIAKQISTPTQVAIKGLLGFLTIFVGLKMTWTSLGGGFWMVLKQLTIVILAMMLGKLTGRLLHLQKGLNRLGKYAKERMAQADPTKAGRQSEGFITATVLFCVGPMAILGSVQDGLTGNWETLGLKAILDGMATMAFVSMFGWGVILAVIPVVAYQGTITLCARLIAPYLNAPGLIDSMNATGGLLVFCIALIILELKKVELADYLPSLIYAPLITWLWK